MIVPITAACIAAAAQFYSLPEKIVWTVLYVEHGRTGSVSPNTNGTFDMGSMQVNSVHLDELSRLYSVSRATIQEKLTNDGCFNAAVGAWQLKRQIVEAGDFWTGVGHYHSKTPALAQAFIRRCVTQAMTFWGPRVFQEPSHE